jgi:hypothetical protein
MILGRWGMVSLALANRDKNKKIKSNDLLFMNEFIFRDLF